MTSKGIRRNFPNDSDGDVLRRLEDAGVDLSLPREVDFYCYAHSKASAASIARKMVELGFSARIFTNSDSTSITKRHSVYGTITIVPSYEQVIAIQSELNVMLADYGTVCDGWGTAVEPPSSA